jgi:hypothetical protein
MLMTPDCCVPLHTIKRVMEEFPKTFGHDEYVVAIIFGGSGYLYYLLAMGGHDDALQTCLRQHKAMARPLPSGVAYWVVGGCKQEDCKCGGGHIRNRTYYPGTSTPYEQ